MSRRQTRFRGSSGTTRERRPPQRIADVLATLMSQRGYSQLQTTEACQQAWNDTVGQRLGEQSRAGKVRRGVLEVLAANSTTLQEIVFQKRQIVDQLNQLVPDEGIRDLRLRVGPID